MIFDTDGNIWFRQSWLDTAMRCPERGRLATVKSEWDAKSSDLALVGTGAHAAIELDIDTLNGKTVEHADPYAAIEHAVVTDAENGIKWTKLLNVQQILDQAALAYEAWVRDVKPTFEARGLLYGAHTEVEFQQVLFTLPDGRTVGIKGTADLVGDELGDWKTAGREYKLYEKQKYAIQPTIYAMAAVRGGLVNSYRYPLTFNYGVMVFNSNREKVKGQIVTVRRTAEHEHFAIQRIKSYVDLALNFTLQRPWPMDDDHFLCNSTWCPWWTICKGASGISDEQPVQLKIHQPTEQRSVQV